MARNTLDNSTWHETQPGFAKLHIRRGHGRERGGEKKKQERKDEIQRGKKIYGSDKKERKTNQTRKKETRREKMSLHGLVSVSIAAIFPLTGPTSVSLIPATL